MKKETQQNYELILENPLLFGSHLCELRKSKGLTQEELAAQLSCKFEKNFTNSKISRHEYGESLDLKTLLHYATFYNISIDDLLDIEPVEKEVLDTKDVTKIFNLLSSEKKKNFINYGKFLANDNS